MILFSTPAGDAVLFHYDLGSGIDASHRKDILTALWGVEATLFILTVAVTSLLVNIGRDDDERSWLLRRYRRDALDWIVIGGLAILAETGRQVLLSASASPSAHEPNLLRPAILFLLDLAALCFLVYYSHTLLTASGQPWVNRALAAQRSAWERDLFFAYSRAVLSEWGADRGVQPALYPIQEGGAPYAYVRATHAGRLHDIRLARLDRWIADVAAPLWGTHDPTTKTMIHGTLDHPIRLRQALAIIAPSQAAHIDDRTATAFVVRRS